MAIICIAMMEEPKPLSDVQKMYNEVVEDFTIHGEPIHPRLLLKFHPSNCSKCIAYSCKRITTINLSNSVQAWESRGYHSAIERKNSAVFTSCSSDYHCDACSGYSYYVHLGSLKNGIQIVELTQNRDADSQPLTTVLLLQPKIKTMMSGRYLHRDMGDGWQKDWHAQEYVALDLVGHLENPIEMESLQWHDDYVTVNPLSIISEAPVEYGVVHLPVDLRVE